MKDRRIWLVFKGILILVLVCMILGFPTNDNFRKWLRFIMLIIFVISFIIDLNAYKRKNN